MPKGFKRTGKPKGTPATMVKCDPVDMQAPKNRANDATTFWLDFRASFASKLLTLLAQVQIGGHQGTPTVLVDLLGMLCVCKAEVELQGLSRWQDQ